MAADWVTPTGHEDPANHWADEAKAYDDDTGTYSSHNFSERPTSEIILTHVGVSSCTKIRFMMVLASGSPYYGKADIRVYYSGGWHTIATDQTYPTDDWQEVNVGSSQTISKVGFIFKPMAPHAQHPQLREVDFYGETAVLHEKTLTDGIQFTDMVIKNPIKILSDGIAVTDTLVKQAIKILSDGIAVGESLTGYRLLAKTVVDGIAIGEVLCKHTIKVLSDGIKFTDVCFKTVGVVLIDGIAIGESLVKLTVKVLVDGIKFTDIRFTTFVKVFVDGIKFHDFLYKWRWLKPTRLLPPTRLLQPTRILKPK